MDRGPMEGHLYGTMESYRDKLAASVSEGQRGGQCGLWQKMSHQVRPECGEGRLQPEGSVCVWGGYQGML